MANLHTFTFGPSAVSVAQQRFAELQLIHALVSDYIPTLLLTSPPHRLSHLLALLHRTLALLENDGALTPQSIVTCREIVAYIASTMHSEPLFRDHLSALVFGRLFSMPSSISWLSSLFHPSPKQIVDSRLLEQLAALIPNDADESAAFLS